MYPVFYVDFFVRVVCERECVKTQDKLKIKGVFKDCSWEAFLRSEAMCSIHDWNAKSHDRWWQLLFVSISQVRPSHEIPAKHSILLFCHIWYTMSLPTLYIPILPTYWEECFSTRKPNHNPWKWEIVIPTIIYTIHCGFPQLLPLHIQILERLIAQTLTTPILSVKWGFGAVGKYCKKPFVWWIQLGWIAWSRELKKTRFRQVNW